NLLVPTEVAVKEAYADLTQFAKENNFTIEMPALDKLRETFLQEVERLENQLGRTSFIQQLRRVGNVGQDSADLGAIWDLQKSLRGQMADLAGDPSSYAKGRMRIYGRMLDAIDTDMKALEQANPTVAQWGPLLRDANNMNLRYQTHEDLNKFMDTNMFDINP